MPSRRPLAVAHRGDPYQYRENTLPSLRSAVRAGADAVEVDVRVTRDGVPVLLHDATLHRLWGVGRAVADVESYEVRRLGVPTLGDGFAALAGAGECRVMADIMDREGARATVGAVREHGDRDRVYYCGSATCMLAVRRHDRAAEIALTWKRAAPPPWALLAEVRPRWINLPFGLASPALVDRVHADGLLVGVWTVDVRWNMVRLVRLGVDAVTTNRIAVLRRVIAPPRSNPQVEAAS